MKLLPRVLVLPLLLTICLACTSPPPTTTPSPNPLPTVTPIPTATPQTQATVAAGVSATLAATPTTTPIPTPTPATMPALALDCEGCPTVILDEGQLRDSTFRRNQEYHLVGCFFDESIDGPRGPQANRELIFSHKYQAHVDDQVIVNWGPSVTRDSPSKGCYELIATYTGQGEYVYCTNDILGGCQFGGIDVQFPTFKVLEYTGISSGKWSAYRALPPTPTPVPTAAPAPTTTPEPTVTRMPTGTPQPTATLAPTPTPTATPMPTMPAPTPTPTATPENIETANFMSSLMQNGWAIESPNGEIVENISLSAWDNKTKADALLDTGNFEEALAMYKRALNIHGKPSYLLDWDVGFIYEMLGQFKPAIDHYTRSLEVYDDNGIRADRAYAYMNLGLCHQAKPEAEMVLKGQEVITGLDSAHRTGHLTLAMCYQSEGNWRNAIHHTNKYIGVNRSIEGYEGIGSDLFYLGTLHAANDDCAEAKRISEDALAAPVYEEPGHNSHAGALMTIITCLTEEENFAEALPLAERRLAIVTESGYTTQRIERFKETVEQIRQLSNS